MTICRHCFKRREKCFQKGAKKILEALAEEKGYTTVSLDEFFFFYDSLARRVWIHKNITGSHKHTCLFGAIGLNGKQLFRQYDRFNEDNFYKYLKQVHRKFPKCYLLLDKAPQYYKSQQVM